MPTRLQLAKKQIESAFESMERKLFTTRDLSTLLSDRRSDWRLAQSTTTQQFISYLSRNSNLQRIRLSCPEYSDIVRYAWGDPSPFEVALSLRPKSYLSHGTAVFLHGLTDQLPQTIYVNREQSPKPGVERSLSQEGINRAFSGQQRASQYIFSQGKFRFVVLSGKHTNQLGVETVIGPAREKLAVTCIERTLIDIVVRPGYAGGVYEVRAAYENVRDRLSISKLLSILKQLDHTYPYHQAIGFLLERTGYPKSQVDRLLKLGIDYDFFLGHGIEDPEYSDKWRLFHPRGY